MNILVVGNEGCCICWAISSSCIWQTSRNWCCEVEAESTDAAEQSYFKPQRWESGERGKGDQRRSFSPAVLFRGSPLSDFLWMNVCGSVPGGFALFETNTAPVWWPEVEHTDFLEFSGKQAYRPACRLDPWAMAMHAVYIVQLSSLIPLFSKTNGWYFVHTTMTNKHISN